MTDTNWRRRPGRPPLPEGQGKLQTLGTRITQELRDNLEQAALKSGRSLSAEIEHRLEKSIYMDTLAQEMFDRYPRLQIEQGNRD